MNASHSPISEASTISPLTATSPSSVNAQTPKPSTRRATSSQPSSVPGRPSSTPTSPARKPRARELLRQHYGLTRASSGGDIASQSQNQSQSASSSRRASVFSVRPPGERSNDPLDLDSPAFDAKAYYQQLILGSSIVGLLRKENELLTEIRQLDGERQSLVYNHHHELIEASDTIAAMRARAESLEGDLDKLKDAFSEISRLTSELSGQNQRVGDNS